MPTQIGLYYWDEYGTQVWVELRPPSRRLWITPPIRGAITIPITKHIAGDFTLIMTTDQWLNEVRTIDGD